MIEFNYISFFFFILSENWFSVDAKEPIAFVILEVLEAVDMKPSDLNGM